MTRLYDDRRAARLRALAFFGWMAAIFLYSSLPGGKRPDLEGPYSDKLLHAAVYLVLGGLLFRWMLCWKRPARDRRFARFAIIAVITAAYALSDEMHQALVPGRVYDNGDLFADIAGGLLAALGALLPWPWQVRLAHLRWSLPVEKTLAPEGANSAG